MRRNVRRRRPINANVPAETMEDRQSRDIVRLRKTRWIQFPDAGNSTGAAGLAEASPGVPDGDGKLGGAGMVSGACEGVGTGRPPGPVGGGTGGFAAGGAVASGADGAGAVFGAAGAGATGSEVGAAGTVAGAGATGSAVGAVAGAGTTGSAVGAGRVLVGA